jgi:hypothetical protein
MMECHQQIVETYRQEMDAKCGGLKTVENLYQIHNIALEKAQDSYAAYVRQYGDICVPYINKAVQVC